MDAAMREFMSKQGLPLDLQLERLPEGDRWLNFAAGILQNAADLLETELETDIRVYRAQLMMEELGEVIRAMVEVSDSYLLDGLSDLLYVTIGTGCTFNLPTIPGFWEAHRSNMTKAVRAPNDPRIRDKGKDWEEPDFERVLEEHRCKQ